MHKVMATIPKRSVKKTKIDEFAAKLIAEISRRLEEMSPEARAEVDRKILEIAARVRAKRGKK